MRKLQLKWALVFGMVLALGACLQPIRMPSVAPQVNVPAAPPLVLVALPKAALADLVSLAQKLVIHVYSVEGGVDAKEVHEAYLFTLSNEGLYSLEGLPIGELSFAISLTDINGLVLAEAQLRAIINPGTQTLPQVILRPKKPTAVALDLSVGLNLLNFPSAPVPAPTEPAEVRAILKAYRCQNCHSAASPTAGLNLQDFPYKTADNQSLPAILARVYSTITGAPEVSIMPPSNQVTVTAAEAETIKAFITQLNAKTEANVSEWVKEVQLSLNTGDSSRLESSLVLKNGLYVLTEQPSLLAGQRYTYSLTVSGPGSSKLYEVVDAALDLPLDGKVRLKLDINYLAPNVIVPIIVEPAGS